MSPAKPRPNLRLYASDRFSTHIEAWHEDCARQRLLNGARDFDNIAAWVLVGLLFTVSLVLAWG